MVKYDENLNQHQLKLQTIKDICYYKSRNIYIYEKN